MTSAPTRLLEGGDLSEVERELLSAGVASPIGYDVAAGTTRFRAELAAMVATGAAGVAGAGAARSGGAIKALFAKLGVKIALGVFAMASFAGAGVVLGMHAASVAPSAAVTARTMAPKAVPIATASPVAPPAVSTMPAPSAIAEPPPVAAAIPAATVHVVHRLAGERTPAPKAAAVETPSPAPPADVARATAPSPAAPADVARATESAPAPTPAAAPAPAASQPLTEIRGIALARTLVVRDPQAALDVLDKVGRDYPRGYFVEERQALTVLALARLGRQSAARDQAAAFLRAYPNGPFSDQIRAVAAP
ncbi:MAG TPA: hypothetical protein VHV30_00685 [Polyangiaceae bacterium]|nr:hypothetical protein [Polyangiaceae bacterium]